MAQLHCKGSAKACHPFSSRAPTSRKAFTLVELLVAITLFMVLTAMVIAVLPRVNEQARAANGGIQLQGWLTAARSKAIRDQAPRGVRLLKTNNGAGTTAIQAVYIEQPDDFVLPQASTSPPPAPYASTGVDGDVAVTINGLDLTNGSTNPEDFTVQPNDYIELYGNGMLHRIASVTFSGGNTVLGLDATTNPPSSIPFKVNPTRSFRIIRAARVAGDDQLLLPQDVGVDFATNTTYGNSLPFATSGKYLDILFSPSGAVITPGSTTDTFNLWVRDITETDPFAAEPTILAIYLRTGLVAAHPPAPSGNPYAFLLDGQSSGK